MELLVIMKYFLFQRERDDVRQQQLKIDTFKSAGPEDCPPRMLKGAL